MFLCGHSFPLCVKVFKTVFQVRASSLGISSFTVKRKTPLTLTSTHIRRFTRLYHWDLKALTTLHLYAGLNSG